MKSCLKFPGIFKELTSPRLVPAAFAKLLHLMIADTYQNTTNMALKWILVLCIIAHVCASLDENLRSAATETKHLKCENKICYQLCEPYSRKLYCQLAPNHQVCTTDDMCLEGTCDTSCRYT